MFHFFLSQFVVFSFVFGFVRVKISGKWLKTKKNVDKPITEVTVICLRPATALRTCQRHIFCHQPTYLSLIKLILKSQHFCVYSITNDCIQLQLSTANLVKFDVSCKFDVEKIILFIQFCFWFGFRNRTNCGYYAGRIQVRRVSLSHQRKLGVFREEEVSENCGICSSYFVYSLD